MSRIVLRFSLVSDIEWINLKIYSHKFYLQPLFDLPVVGLQMAVRSLRCAPVANTTAGTNQDMG